MSRLFFTTCFVFVSQLLFSQGTQVGGDSSPIYHYNGNVGVGVTGPNYGIDILKDAKSGQELIFKSRITDAPNDYFMIFNGTMASGQFIPSIQAFHNSDNRSSLGILAVTDQSQDNGYNPLMGFDSRLQNGPIQNRPLFGWSSYGHRKMTMLVNGNLGIGTTSPTQRLQVSHSSRVGIQIGGPSTSGGAVADLYFKTADNQRVGGTTYWNWSFRTDSWSSAPGDLVLYSNNGSYTSPFIAQADGDLIFVAGDNSPRKGNVGIGTTSPDYKLDVLGTIRAEEVKVATGWSDFVFEPDYQLRSLEEVEKHISEKGHLPDIPSAEEVEEIGISLGEMDARLLQKIEELTLYVIEQNKKLEELKRENVAQSEEINELKSKIKR